MLYEGFSRTYPANPTSFSTKKLPIVSASIFVRNRQLTASSGVQTIGSFSIKLVLRTTDTLRQRAWH